ncbi:MAG: DNA methyltransferase, partial [Phycisphaerales bacterium]|nr:DNA methyltransferase [Phycisphaerales bacterium]
SFGPIHDTILFYVKSPSYFFTVVRRAYMRGHVSGRYAADATGGLKFISGGNILTGAGKTKGESGRPWRGFDPSKKNRHWAIPGFLTEQMPPAFAKLGVLAKLDALYEAGLVEIRPNAEWPTPLRYLREDDGYPIQDIWSYQPYTEKSVHGTDAGIDADVAWMGPTDPERLGYPTQKPQGLLERIIRSSCPEGGLVLDPFCGCGTAIAAAQSLKRRWIGIEITHLAINLIKNRLRDSFGKRVKYRVVGEPICAPDARELARSDPYQFQWWALGLIGARPVEQQKGADKGTDGRIYFHDSADPIDVKQIAISVKAGQNIGVAMVRDLVDVVRRERAAMGVFISIEEPSKAMRQEAAAAGFYKSPANTKHAEIQLLTIDELLAGTKVDMPGWHESRTFRQATRHRSTTDRNPTLPFEEPS